LPHRHKKTAARTDSTCICGLSFSQKRKNLFGSLEAAIRFFGKDLWQCSVLNLCYSSSKGGNFIWRCCHLIMAKHSSALAHAASFLIYPPVEPNKQEKQKNNICLSWSIVPFVLEGRYQLRYAPPPRTATSMWLSRAKCTAVMISAAVAQRAINAGCLSIMQLLPTFTKRLIAIVVWPCSPHETLM
jgi:hypothetical protein